MGRLFFQYFSGSRLYNCAACDMNLTSHDELISTRFTGSSGKAYLFNKVVNVIYGDRDTREMLTGRHIVCDVSCKNCDTKLGWIYEHAMEESERYKEGRVILEKELICEREGLKNEI